MDISLDFSYMREYMCKERHIWSIAVSPASLLGFISDTCASLPGYVIHTPFLNTQRQKSLIKPLLILIFLLSVNESHCLAEVL